MAKLVVRALEMVPSDSREAGRLLSRYGTVLAIAEGDYEGAKEAFDRALVIAHHEADVESERTILTSMGAVAGFYLRWQECIENTLRSIELANQTDNETILGSHYWAGMASLAMGNLGQAREQSKAWVWTSQRGGGSR